jgi:hypothetical protein
MAQPPSGPNQELIDVAADFAATVKQFNGSDHAEHLRLLKHVDKLRLLLETPVDTIMKQWETSMVIAALVLLVDMGILEAMPRQGSITAKELADVIKIDESAIGRRSFTMIFITGN